MLAELGGVNDTIADDDPLLLLKNSYYLNSEKWVLDNFGKMEERLKENCYPTTFYSTILEVTCNLIGMGFDDKLYKDVENQMRILIDQYRLAGVIASPVPYSSESQEFKRITKTIDSLNEMILTNASNGRRKTLETVLESNDWVTELGKYIDNEKNRIATPIFSRIPTDTWVSRIVKSLPDEAYRFRSIVRNIYPNKYNLELLKQDGYNIACIAAALKEQVNNGKVNDKVLRQNIKWLINDFEELCSMLNESDRS